MEAFQLCSEAENHMKRIGIEISFKMCRLVILILNSITVTLFVSAIIIFIFSNKTFNAISYLCLTKAIPIVIMTTPMFNFLYLGTLLYSRFKELNKFIENQLYDASGKVCVELSTLALLHYKLCNACNKMIFCNEYVLLTYYLLTFLQLGIFLLDLMGYFKRDLEYSDIMANLLLMITNIAALVLINLQKNASMLTGPALCDLTEAYYNDRMNEQVGKIFC